MLFRSACQGLTEHDIDGNEKTAAEVAADWGCYMFTMGELTGAYLNGVITAAEMHRAEALWYMLRYGCITDMKLG